MKTGVKDGCLEASALEALNKLSENLDCVVVVDPEMINSNAKEMRPGESIDQYLNDDIYIEVKYHIDLKEYKSVFLTIYNKCFLKIMQIGFSHLKIKNSEFDINDYAEQYCEYLKLKYKAPNLDEYNKISQNFLHLYNLKNYSPFFLIFEKIQRHIFMILENLCLDSLIAYFHTLVKNYDCLYQRKNE